MRNILHPLLVLSAIAGLIDASAVFAQSPDPPPTPAVSPESIPVPSTVEQPAELPRLTFVDRRMAAWLAVDMQAGIDLANWAGNHSHDERVKQFAQNMAGQWLGFLKVLDERTGGRATAAIRAHAEEAGADDAQESPGEARRPKPAARLSVLNAERLLMRMKLEIAEDSSGALRAQVESRPNANSDLTYIGSEVFRQVQLLSTIKVLRRYGSPGFEPILDEAIKMSGRQLADTMAMLAIVHGSRENLALTPKPTVAGK